MIKRYKKKSVVVEAVRIERTEESVRDALNFMEQGNGISIVDIKEILTTCPGVVVETNHGIAMAKWGDHIIHGDDFYPCKADVFEATYEEESYSSSYCTTELEHEVKDDNFRLA